MNKSIVIGVGGFARSGKDTFVKIARKLLDERGYKTTQFAFAGALKYEIGPFIEQYYGIDVLTDNTEEKNLIRPLLVAHGCQKRIQSKGNYWIDSVDKNLENISPHVVFISDCRFPNEVEWIHNKWNGWFVHLKKYSMFAGYKKFDDAPNAEEAFNDPMIQKGADYLLDLENVVEREERLTGNKITLGMIIDNTYLKEEIKVCLSKCPLLTFK
jgi:hypothetical protein